MIEADAAKLAHIPLQKSGLEIVVTRDLRPYRTRKVRILNGAHTMSVLLGHLAGYVTVEQMLGDEVFCRYLEKGIAEEIISEDGLGGKAFYNRLGERIGRELGALMDEKELLQKRYDRFRSFGRKYTEKR